MSTALLLAEPEPATRGFLERHLRHDGFEILAEGEARPDLVLVADGVELDCWRGEAPVIVLGRAEADLVDRVHAFRRGCDDYIARPFDYQELVERIRAVLRRAQPQEEERIDVGPLAIDHRTRTVRLHDVRVALSQKEYQLLLALARDPGRVFTKAELLRDVWGYRSPGRTRTLDSHASRLRRKLRALDAERAFVENVWGVGYRLLGELPAQ